MNCRGLAKRVMSPSSATSVAGATNARPRSACSALTTGVSDQSDVGFETVPPSDFVAWRLRSLDPATSRVIDVHHPLHGVSLGGSILMMPTSRGSCSGSGVLLDMALNGRAPAALVFSDAEDVLTLGASVAAEMFGRPLPVLRATPTVFDVLARAKSLDRDQRKLCRGRGCDDPHRAA